MEENEGDDEPRGLDLGRYELWQRHEGRGACRPAKIMHSDDIPEEFYLVMAQDMLLRHRGDATDEVVRVLPSASTFAAGTPQKSVLEGGGEAGMKNGGAPEMEDGGAAVLRGGGVARSTKNSGC